MTPSMQRDLVNSEFSEKINAALLANRMGSVRLIDYDKYPQSQLDGIDMITPQGSIDDKMIAGQLPTFAFEVGAFNYSDKYKGWFSPDRNLKTKYINLSYYTVSKEAGGTGNYKDDKNTLVPFEVVDGKKVYDTNDISHIDNLEVILLNKNKLMEAVKDYFKENGLDFQKQIEDMKETYAENKGWYPTVCNIQGKVSNNTKNDKMRFVITNNIPERPINLVITKEFMEESGAIEYREVYSKDAIKACLEASKELNKNSDIVIRDNIKETEQAGLCTLRLNEYMMAKCVEVDKQEAEFFKRQHLTKQDRKDWYDKQEIGEYDGLNNIDEYIEFYKYTIDDMDNGAIPYCDYFEKLDKAADYYIKDYNSYDDLLTDNPRFAESLKLSMEDYLENLSDLSDDIKDKYNLSSIEGLELD